MTSLVAEASELVVQAAAGLIPYINVIICYDKKADTQEGQKKPTNLNNRFINVGSYGYYFDSPIFK